MSILQITIFSSLEVYTIKSNTEKKELKLIGDLVKVYFINNCKKIFDQKEYKETFYHTIVFNGIFILGVIVTYGITVLSLFVLTPIL